MSNALRDYVLQAIDQVPANLQAQGQGLASMGQNALRWVRDPAAAFQALRQRFTGGLSRYQQLLEASGDPTRPAQTPAEAQARAQLVQVMQGMVGPQTVGMMAGPMAATADLAALAKAHAMQNVGEHPAEIWHQTGWATPQMTPDEKPRFEIPDQGAQVNLQPLVDRYLQAHDPSTVPLGAVLDHPQLLQAYPQLGKVQVGVLPEGTTSMGQFDPRTSTLRLDAQPAYMGQARSTILHELQHAVQGIEVTSPGGAPSMFVPMHLEDLHRVMQLNDQLQTVDPASPEAAAMRAERDEIFADTSTPVDEHAARVMKMRQQHDQEAQTYVEHANRGHPEAQRYVDEAVKQLQERNPAAYAEWAQQLTPKGLQERATALRLLSENPRFVKAYAAWQKARARLSPLQQYKRLGGEAEARLTEYRSQLSPETLRQLYPYATGHFKLATGVPLQELIHLSGYRNALSAYLP